MTDNTIEKLNNLEVGTQILAGFLGMSARRIRQLTEDGVLVPCSQTGKARKYNFGDSVRAYITYKENGSRTNDERDQLEDLKKKKLIADTALRNSQRELHEMKTRLFEGTIVEVDEVKEDYEHFFKVFKRLTSAIPPRVAGEVSAYVSDPVEVRKIEQDIADDLNQTLTSFIDAARPKERDKS